MQEKFRNMDEHCRLFLDNMSLPNISRTIGYKYCEKAVFSICPMEMLKVKGLKGKSETTLLAVLLLFSTEGVTANVSKIEDTDNIVKVIKTYDANALYPKCMMSFMPVGNNVHVFSPDGNNQWRHTELGKTQDSFQENLWIDRENSLIKETSDLERMVYDSHCVGHTYPENTETICYRSIHKFT